MLWVLIRIRRFYWAPTTKVFMMNWPKLSFNYHQIPTFIYCLDPKFWDTRILCCNLPIVQPKRPNLRVLCQNDANGTANSEDPDQILPIGAVWSGSALFAQTYLSKNLGSLQYSSLSDAWNFRNFTTHLFIFIQGIDNKFHHSVDLCLECMFLRLVAELLHLSYI